MTVRTAVSRLLVLGLSVFVVLRPAQAAPPATAPAAERQVLVPVVTGSVDKAIMSGFDEFVAKARQFYPDHKVRVGKEVKEPLKKAVARCGEDLACVAKLGVKEKLAEIIVMRVRPEAGGVAMTFIAVDVATARAVRTVEALFTKPDDVQPVAAARFFAIVGITTPGSLTVPGAPAGGEIDGQPADLAVGKVELSPGVHLVKLNDHEVKTMILPGETRTLTLEEFGIAPPPPEPLATPELVKPEPAKPARGEGTKVAKAGKGADKAASPAPPPEPEASATPPPPPAKEAKPAATTSASASTGSRLPSHLLAYAGYGTAGLGLVLMGVGGYYGTQTNVKLSSTTSQAQAKRMNDDAESAASRANMLLGVGGGLVVVGAALWAVDTYLLGSKAEAGVTVAPAGSGAAAGLWLRF